MAPFEGGLQRSREFLAALAAQLRRLRQHAGDIVGARFLVFQPFVKGAELLLLRVEQEAAEFLKFIHWVTRTSASPEELG